MQRRSGTSQRLRGGRGLRPLRPNEPTKIVVLRMAILQNRISDGIVLQHPADSPIHVAKANDPDLVGACLQVFHDLEALNPLRFLRQSCIADGWVVRRQASVPGGCWQVKTFLFDGD